MATKNHTTLHDFIAVLEGQNTKNNGQREKTLETLLTRSGNLMIVAHKQDC